jgi:hypothetical protein
MKHGCSVLCLAAALVVGSAVLAEEAPPATTSNDGMEGNVQFLIGQSYFGDVWQPLDQPAAFGVEVDFAPKRSPVHVALASSVSGDSARVVNSYLGHTGHVAVGFAEFSAGFVWLPVKHAIARPYLGAGVLSLLAGVDAGANAWNGGDADQTFGFYANAGLFFKVGSSFNIGFDGRIVRGTNVTLVGTKLDADYERASLLLGFSWGE